MGGIQILKSPVKWVMGGIQILKGPVKWVMGVYKFQRVMLRGGVFKFPKVTRFSLKVFQALPIKVIPL
jgi:hypothetical protein